MIRAIIVFVLTAVLITALVGLILWDFEIDLKLMRKWGAIKSFFAPKSDLDKEIAYERKVNKQLTAQKIKIAQLAIIKEENEALLEEVEERSVWPDYSYCIFCRENYHGDRCGCHDNEKYAVNPLEYLTTEETECERPDENIKVTIDGFQIPGTFSSKREAEEYVERYEPTAAEIEMRGNFR